MEADDIMKWQLVPKSPTDEMKTAAIGVEVYPDSTSCLTWEEACLIPEAAVRLQACAFVRDAELSRLDRSDIIRMAAEKMAEKCLRKLLSDCIRTEGDCMGHQGQTLTLDVYVLSPKDLYKMIADAIRRGAEDERRVRI